MLRKQSNKLSCLSSIMPGAVLVQFWQSSGTFHVQPGETIKFYL